MEKSKAEKLVKSLFQKKKKPVKEDLSIEDDGTIGRDISLLAPGTLFECPDKLEPSPQGKKLQKAIGGHPTHNIAARERLERQIDDLIIKVKQGLTYKQNATKDALDVLGMARAAVYTDPMGEVSVMIHEAARRLLMLYPEESRKSNNLANLAMEIRQSEGKDKS